jgi:arylsulfatase A-like enzyme
MSSSTNPSRAWPKAPRPRDGAPNILVFLTDDVGYGACSTFGGPIHTPALDALAAHGLRFTQFHTTAMCSPTRAALLTGRNPHRVSMGRVTARPSYYEGYTSVIPKSAGTMPDILRRAGYNTAMFGKWHLTPEWEITPQGPFDRWPTGMGFEYFYGFLGFDTNMWTPDLVENTSFVPGGQDTPLQHFDERMADRAIDWFAQQKALTPEKPFFAYIASGTAHSPHHAPRPWLEKYRGTFDKGWDEVRSQTFRTQKQLGVIPADAVLTERPENLQSWASLGQDQRTLASRLMEAYAAALDHFDHQVQRIVEFLKVSGQFDNTLILFIQGDNGGSAEGGFNGLLFEQSWANGFEEKLQDQLCLLDQIGGPDAYNHFPAAWGWAINTPFKYYKQIASHFGGTRNGLVVSWPDGFKARDGRRSQFHHVADIMPTVLEAAGVEAPAQIDGVRQDSIDGVSMLYAFHDESAPSGRNSQVFESMQNFSIYRDGWLACSTPVNDPWEHFASRSTTDAHERNWELYHVARDYSQAVDLAQAQPQRLRSLQDEFWKQAEWNRILPIHAPSAGGEGRPSLGAGRTEFVFRRRVGNIHADAAPHTIGRSFRITCELVMSSNGRGVIACQGSSTCGYSFYIHDGRPVFYYNAIRPHVARIEGHDRLSPGRHAISAEVRLDDRAPGSGAAMLLDVDGHRVAQGRIERTLRTLLNQNGFNVGQDTVSAISPDYTIEDSALVGEFSHVTFQLL